MPHRESVNRSCLTILVIAIFGILISLPVFFLTRIIFYSQNINPPADWLLVCVTFVIVAVIFLCLIMWPYSKKLILKRFGTQTSATVIESDRCDNSEDICMCGYYQYRDSHGQEHKAKFKICFHWPSHEQWEMVQKGYSKGAINNVKYLRWLPFVHEINFPI